MSRTRRATVTLRLLGAEPFFRLMTTTSRGCSWPPAGARTCRASWRYLSSTARSMAHALTRRVGACGGWACGRAVISPVDEWRVA